MRRKPSSLPVAGRALGTVSGYVIADTARADAPCVAHIFSPDRSGAVSEFLDWARANGGGIRPWSAWQGRGYAVRRALLTVYEAQSEGVP